MRSHAGFLENVLLVGHPDESVLTLALDIQVESESVWLIEATFGDLSFAAQAKAVANYDYRVKKDIGHFNLSVYANALHGDIFLVNYPSCIRNLQEQNFSRGKHHARFLSEAEKRIDAWLDESASIPHKAEQAYGYAHRLLSALIPTQQTDRPL
jgi:hypothetical protein